MASSGHNGPSGIRDYLIKFLQAAVIKSHPIPAAELDELISTLADKLRWDTVAWSWAKGCHTAIGYLATDEYADPHPIEELVRRITVPCSTIRQSTKALPVDIYLARLNRIAIKRSSESEKRSLVQEIHQDMLTSIMSKYPMPLDTLRLLLTGSETSIGIIQPELDPPLRPTGVNLIPLPDYPQNISDGQKFLAWKDTKPILKEEVEAACKRLLQVSEDSFIRHITSTVPSSEVSEPGEFASQRLPARLPPVNAPRPPAGSSSSVGAGGQGGNLILPGIAGLESGEKPSYR